MPIPLRSACDAARVRVAARESKNANQVRRLLALAAIYDGASRAEAAEIGGVTRQIIRDWVLKFNTDGPDGLIDRKAPGQPPRLNETHRTALAAAIESGPIPAVHGVARWRTVSVVPGPLVGQWAIGGAQCHGINSSIRSCGQPFTRRVSRSVM